MTHLKIIKICFIFVYNLRLSLSDDTNCTKNSNVTTLVIFNNSSPHMREVTQSNIELNVTNAVPNETDEARNFTFIAKNEESLVHNTSIEVLLDDPILFNISSSTTIQFISKRKIQYFNRRVYNGEKTKIKHFPFVVSVHVMGKFQCAGSIIKSDLVITACSCVQLLWNNRFYKENPNILSIRVGSTYYAGGGEEIPALEIFFHPSYNPKTLANNLAIIRLVRVLTFRRKRVKKITLSKRENIWSSTEKVIMLGWGAKTRANVIGNPLRNKLTFSELPVYPFSECRHIYNKLYVNNNNFCGGFLSKGGGACNGDVGGPGVIDDELAGVISFGSGRCGERNRPTVFTKLANYVDWIENIMEMRPPRKKVNAPTADYMFGLTSNESSDSSAAVKMVTPLEEPSKNIQFPRTQEIKNNKTKNIYFKDFLTSLLQSEELLNSLGKRINESVYSDNLRNQTIKKYTTVKSNSTNKMKSNRTIIKVQNQMATKDDDVDIESPSTEDSNDSLISEEQDVIVTATISNGLRIGSNWNTMTTPKFILVTAKHNNKGKEHISEDTISEAVRQIQNITLDSIKNKEDIVMLYVPDRERDTFRN